MSVVNSSQIKCYPVQLTVVKRSLVSPDYFSYQKQDLVVRVYEQRIGIMMGNNMIAPEHYAWFNLTHANLFFMADSNVVSIPFSSFAHLFKLGASWP